MDTVRLMKLAAEGIASTIGNTPLVRLNRIPQSDGMRLYAKLEGCNPWGSIKDRTALQIVRDAIDDGHINADTVLVESSSGNLGLALAHICNYLKIRFICVVDRRTNSAILRILELLGTEVVMVDPPPGSAGNLLTARLDVVRQIRAKQKNVYWPNQYANRSNPAAHRQTMQEICEQLKTAPDVLFVPVSTCGTLRGCVDYIRENKLRTKVIAVDAIGSSITGTTKGKRLLPGHGAGIVPPHYNPGLADDHVHVTDAEAVAGCRRLIAYESLIAGASSGAAVMAFEKVKSELDPNSSCVLILPDRGERYLDTVFSEPWVRENLLHRETTEAKEDEGLPSTGYNEAGSFSIDEADVKPLVIDKQIYTEASR